MKQNSLNATGVSQQIFGGQMNNLVYEKKIRLRCGC
jgi:hypothetical protein